MTRETRQGTHLELPIEIIEELRAADEDMWRIVTDAVQTYLAVETDSLAALQRRAEMLDEEITELEDEIQSLETEREELVAQKERIEAQFERLKANRRAYDEIIDEIIDRLAADPSLSIASQRSDLTAAAEIRNDGIVTEDAIDEVCSDVRSRVDERAVQINSKRLYRDQMMNTDEYEQTEHEPALRSLQGDDNGKE